MLEEIFQNELEMIASAPTVETAAPQTGECVFKGRVNAVSSHYPDGGKTPLDTFTPEKDRKFAKLMSENPQRVVIPLMGKNFHRANKHKFLYVDIPETDFGLCPKCGCRILPWKFREGLQLRCLGVREHRDEDLTL